MDERERQYFEQFGETIQDEFGGIYSSDGIWLLSAPIGRHKTYKEQGESRGTGSVS